MCNKDSFAVSAHVLDALNHLQQAQFSRKKIWIDAICINQEDDVEKAVQVAHMQSIYARAEEVFVWLGASEDDSDLAIDHIPSIIEYAVKNWQDFLQDKDEIPHPTPPDATLTALGHLYVRPWFTRVWVVPELLLARSAVLVCGNRRIDWDSFAALTGLLLQQNLTDILASPTVPRMAIALGAQNVNMLHNFRKQGPIIEGLPVPAFADLLQYCRLRKVTEPVDRVWAFLGLAQPDVQQIAGPLIDYSLEGRRDYHKAYVNLFKVLLPKDSSLYLLSLAPSLQRPSGLPSWCPNFHSPPCSGGNVQALNPSFQAGVRKKAQAAPLIVFSPNSDILQLQGFRIDRVDKIIKLGARGPRSWEEGPYTREEVHDWEQSCLELAQKVYDQPKGIPDAHWRTLIVDIPVPKRRSISREAYSTYRRMLSVGHVEKSDLTAEAKLAFKEFSEILAGVCERSYFSTRGGRVGLGPPGIAPGDRICIFYGAKAPHILRFKSNDRSCSTGWRCLCAWDYVWRSAED